MADFGFVRYLLFCNLRAFRPSPFCPLLSNTLPDFGSVGRKRKKRPKEYEEEVWN